MQSSSRLEPSFVRRRMRRRVAKLERASTARDSWLAALVVLLLALGLVVLTQGRHQLQAEIADGAVSRSQ